MPKRREEAWAGSIAPVRGGRGSALLSGCITNLGKIRNRSLLLKMFAWHIILTWYVLAELEAAQLGENRVNLGHNALNVHAAWRNGQRRIWSAQASAALGLAKAEAAYEKGEALPHQLALSYTEMAKSISWWLVTMETDYEPPGPRRYVRRLVDEALKLADAIRAEADQPQGLRQLARVYKHLADIAFHMGWPRERSQYLSLAAAVAEEGGTGSQLADIRRMKRVRA
jgi:hypothetical protein